MGTIDDLTKCAVHMTWTYFDNPHQQDEKPQYQVTGPAPEVRIRSAEKELGAVFPNEYHKFIAAHGALLGNGFERYGPSSEQDGEMPLFAMSFSKHSF